MSRIALRIAVFASLLAPLASPALAGAQSAGTVTREGDSTEATTTTSTGATTTSSGTTTSSSGTSSLSSGGADDLDDDQALLEEREAPPAQRSGFEPGEVQDETYIFVGALARAQILPSYPFDIAGQVIEGGYDVPVNGAGGVYFNYRRNGFNVLLEVYYQGMEWEGFVHDASDADSETEYIRSRLGIVYGYVGFGWAFDLADWFAIELGFGLGLGGVIGDLYRQEATRDATGNWQACDRPNTTPDPYCEGPVEMVSPEGRLDDDRVRGGTYQLGPVGIGPNPHYFGPGGVPPMFATIDLPRLSFRFKPLHQLQIRIDTAFNLYGISLGGSIGYGF